MEPEVEIVEPRLVVRIDGAAAAIGRIAEELLHERAVLPEMGRAARVVVRVDGVEISPGARGQGNGLIDQGRIVGSGLSRAGRADAAEILALLVVDPHLPAVAGVIPDVAVACRVEGHGAIPNQLLQVCDERRGLGRIVADSHEIRADKPEEGAIFRTELDAAGDGRGLFREHLAIGRVEHDQPPVDDGVDRDVSAERTQRRDAVDAAPGRLDLPPAAVLAHTLRTPVLLAPLLHHPQPHGLRRHVGAEIHGAVEVQGFLLGVGSGLIVAAPLLAVFGDRLPAVHAVERGRAVAGEGIDLRDLAIDLLERQATERLRLVPLEEEHAGVLFRERFLTPCVPLTGVGIVDAGTHPHSGPRSDVFKPGPQQTHPLESPEPFVAGCAGVVRAGHGIGAHLERWAVVGGVVLE